MRLVERRLPVGLAGDEPDPEVHPVGDLLREDQTVATLREREIGRGERAAAEQPVGGRGIDAAEAEALLQAEAMAQREPARPPAGEVVDRELEGERFTSGLRIRLAGGRQRALLGAAR